MQPVISSAAIPAVQTVHPLLVRVTHWINAAAVFIMVSSGWQIYNASPIFGFVFPAMVTLGGWLGGALRWHFAAMWLLAINGLCYLGFGLATGRFRRKFFPLSLARFLVDVLDALSGQLSHAEIDKYNYVQKTLYQGVIAALVLIVLSGLSLWKPVQFWWLTLAFGGFQSARTVHFLAMAAIASFAVVHVVMAVLVPKTIRAMIFGR